MIIYSVTTNIEDSVKADWLTWMQSTHIPEVMQTGMFKEYRFMRVIGDEESGGGTYSVQYLCESMEKFKEYEAKFATALRAETIARYQDKFIAFRTLLEVVE
ncbi:MAG: DUF4286 family protein [Bacteroidetes bacterium]|nr:DUF4286 family protein [Bacteroidota bacterium]